tara:strand:+ start:168 stop:308 length:141 start_codon:yes stop_codon:yes gene_type:complete
VVPSFLKKTSKKCQKSQKNWLLTQKNTIFDVKTHMPENLDKMLKIV